MSSTPAASESVADPIALVVVWSRDEPQRVGEVLLPAFAGRADHPGFMVGRGDGSDSPRDLPRLGLIRQRPGVNTPTEPMTSRKISRDQFSIHPAANGDGLVLRNIGRRGMVVAGLPIEDEAAQVQVGDLVELQGSLLLLVTRRPAKLPGQTLAPALWPDFGQADAGGLIGESPAIWATRAAIARCAGGSDNVLLLGPEGAGADLAARAIHQASPRAALAFVTADIRKLADEVIDAELFAAGGSLAAAAGGSLYLEGVERLDADRQARLADELGDVRLLLAATAEVEGPLAARLGARVEIPGLDARPEDIGQIVTALILLAADGDEDAQVSLFHDDDRRVGYPRIDPNLVATLIHRDYLSHLRELEDVLWAAMMSSLAGGLRHVSFDVPAVTIEDGADLGIVALTREQIANAIAQAKSEDQAVLILGLRNRYQLRRLVKQFGLD